jgi:pilus assembly protein CpaC
MQMIRPAAARRLSAAGFPIFVIAVFGGATLHAQQPQPVMTTASAVPPVAAAADTATPDTVRLLVGRSTLVDIGTPIARVSLTSADVADALVTSPSQLLVHGKVPGAISMFVWSRGGDVRRFEVAVQRDLTRLTDQVKQLFPNESIQVHGNGRNVVLSGTVSGKEVVDRAIGVALGFVEKKEDVVTLLQVREGRASNQVLLKVRFAEVSRSALTQFGMSFFTSPTGIENTVGRLTTQQYDAPRFSDLAWTKAGGGFGDSVTSAEGKFSFADFLNVFLLSQKWDLGAVIKAMQSRGIFQSLAEPNLVAESGKEASFLAGGEFPVPIVQGSGTNMGISVQFKEFGIRLNFTPTVNGDRVHLKVRPEVSTLDFGNAVVLNGFRIPALSTRRAETELELRNGQTFAVAGLMNNQVASTLQKVPGIGDIPIIGHLFRSRASQKDQTELVVMITPEILATDSDGVTNTLPRTPDTFLAPLPERRTQAPLPPAFTPDRRSTVSVPQPSVAAEIEQKDQRARGEAERDRLAAEARAAADAERERRQQEARANAVAARLAADEARKAEAEAKAAARREAEQAKAAARAAEAEARRQKDEQKRQEKEARERAKKEREAASKAAKPGSPQASAETGDAAPAAAVLQQGDAVQQAVDNAAQQAEQTDEELRAKAIAEAKLRALEAASQPSAQVEK